MANIDPFASSKQNKVPPRGTGNVDSILSQYKTTVGAQGKIIF